MSNVPVSMNFKWQCQWILSDYRYIDCLYFEWPYAQFNLIRWETIWNCLINLLLYQFFEKPWIKVLIFSPLLFPWKTCNYVEDSRNISVSVKYHLLLNSSYSGLFGALYFDFTTGFSGTIVVYWISVTLKSNFCCFEKAVVESCLISITAFVKLLKCGSVNWWT